MAVAGPVVGRGDGRVDPGCVPGAVVAGPAEEVLLGLGLLDDVDACLGDEELVDLWFVVLVDLGFVELVEPQWVVLVDVCPGVLLGVGFDVLVEVGSGVLLGVGFDVLVVDGSVVLVVVGSVVLVVVGSVVLVVDGSVVLVVVGSVVLVVDGGFVGFVVVVETEPCAADAISTLKMAGVTQVNPPATTETLPAWWRNCLRSSFGNASIPERATDFLLALKGERKNAAESRDPTPHVPEFLGAGYSFPCRTHRARVAFGGVA